MFELFFQTFFNGIMQVYLSTLPTCNPFLACKNKFLCNPKFKMNTNCNSCWCLCSTLTLTTHFHYFSAGVSVTQKPNLQQCHQLHHSHINTYVSLFVCVKVVSVSLVFHVWFCQWHLSKILCDLCQMETRWKTSGVPIWCKGNICFCLCMSVNDKPVMFMFCQCVCVYVHLSLK